MEKSKFKNTKVSIEEGNLLDDFTKEDQIVFYVSINRKRKDMTTRRHMQFPKDVLIDLLEQHIKVMKKQK